MRTPAALPLLPLVALMVTMGAHAQSTEQLSTLADQQEVAVTIYNHDLALVKDQRRVALKPGQTALAFRDVSAKIQPESALLRSLSAPGNLSVLEQNFDFDLLSPQKLLEKYVGHSVTVVRTNPTTGQDSSEAAQVLSANAGVVLKIGNHIETGVPGRIVYGDVPANLRDRPTLVMTLDNRAAAAQEVELSYLTAGLGWRADYVVELGAKDDKLDLSGWVTLTNTSGTSYRNAKLQLVAGNVNRVDQVIVTGLRASAVAQAKVADSNMAEEGLLDYHLYTLSHPTTIAENQTKQVALLSGTAVPARKELVFTTTNYYYRTASGEISKNLKAAVFLDFDNKEASHLGLPLPTGVVRVYKKDSSGNAQFVGEDRIDHTPKNQKVRLLLGQAFDVTADKTQTDFKNLGSAGKNRNAYESGYELVLKNAKDEAVQVTVLEQIPGDWAINSTSSPFTKASSNTAKWLITIPAKGSTTLKYRAVVKV